MKTVQPSLIETDDDGTTIVDTDRTNHNYQKTGDLITLLYTEETLIDHMQVRQSCKFIWCIYMDRRNRINFNWR